MQSIESKRMLIISATLGKKTRLSVVILWEAAHQLPWVHCRNVRRSSRHNGARRSRSRNGARRSRSGRTRQGWKVEGWIHGGSCGEVSHLVWGRSPHALFTFILSLLVIVFVQIQLVVHGCFDEILVYGSPQGHEIADIVSSWFFCCILDALVLTLQQWKELIFQTGAVTTMKTVVEAMARRADRPGSVILDAFERIKGPKLFRLL